MNVLRVLRPAQKILTGTVVAAVAATCLVSTSGSELAKREFKSPTGTAPTISAKREYQVTTREVVSAKREYAKRESAGLSLVSLSVYPALTSDNYETRVVDRINTVRKLHHLRPLRPASCATSMSGRWSAHLATQSSLVHRSMRVLLKRCDAKYVGETLGRGEIGPKQLVSMWMHSAPHRHVLLSHSPRRIGVGATPNAQGQWVVAANTMRF